MKPTVGRVVHYVLNDVDVEQISQRPPRVGNPVSEGETYPAMVVQTFGETTVNLQVMLDGDDAYWATSREQGDEPGTWCWPPRV